MINIILKAILNAGHYHSVRRQLASNNSSPIDFSRIRRVLCIQMNAIGDSIMTQPAWSAIRQSLPDATIDLICKPHIKRLFCQDPSINEVFSFEPHPVRFWVFQRRNTLRQLLSEKRYNLIIDFSALPLTAAFCATQKECRTLGFSRKISFATGDVDLSMAYDGSVPYSETDHLRELMLKLVSPLNRLTKRNLAPALTLSQGSETKADEILGQKRLKAKHYIAIHPGAKWPPKKWPGPHYRKLVRLIAAGHNIPMVVLGDPADREFIAGILNGLHEKQVFPIINEDLAVSSAIIKKSLLCVNNDSAAMHIAAAVGTPSISIFGPVSPGRCRPSREEGCRVFYNSTFCSPCTLYYTKNRCRRGINFCMEEIYPADVFDRIKKMIPNR
jgi:ADP-heptose:LPS heptosyltransferase